MRRTEFMKLHGLECANKQWSWSYANHEKKIVVFQRLEKDPTVYSPEWGADSNRIPPGRTELLKNLKLVEEEGYIPMISIIQGYEENGRFHLTDIEKHIHKAELFWDADVLKAKISF